MSESSFYIGLMSGTSMDGIDAAIVALGDHRVDVIAAETFPYSDTLRHRLQTAATEPASCGIDDLADLDTAVGQAFRDAVLAIIDSCGMANNDITAIGSHGQTIRHRPDGERRFTLQIGNPAIIATGTGIDTVADFRRNDFALNGQGAPLVPPFHHWLFATEDEARVVANIGGIANLTLLPASSEQVAGFDCGPGNTLLDLWAREHIGKPFDDNGAWAATGRVDESLLSRMLADDWLATPPPKSTGPEHFNRDWLIAQLPTSVSAQDVQATLVEFTVVCIAQHIERHAPKTRTLLVCGGGASNGYLMQRLQDACSCSLQKTDSFGLNAMWVEAAAFAWLAARRLQGRINCFASVTGASRDSCTGAVYKS